MWSDNKVRELATVCLPWQHWTKALVWFDDVCLLHGIDKGNFTFDFLQFYSAFTKVEVIILVVTKNQQQFRECRTGY